MKNDSQFLLGASQGTEKYKSTLKDPLRQIRGAGSANEINNVVGALEKETNQMLGRSRALEEKNSRVRRPKLTLYAKNLKEAQREAMTDLLKGIANSKYFDIQLCKTVPHSMENGSALSPHVGGY